MSRGYFRGDKEAQLDDALKQAGVEIIPVEQPTEPMIAIPRATLEWWRKLVDLNPSDLAPRMDEYLKEPTGEPK